MAQRNTFTTRKQISHVIEGHEQFGEVMCKELNIYLGRQSYVTSSHQLWQI
jgi:hypothetical protein